MRSVFSLSSSREGRVHDVVHDAVRTGTLSGG